MQDFLTYLLEAIAITYSLCLITQFITGIPTMSRRKTSPRQLDLFDELFNDQVENPAIELSAVDEAVVEIDQSSMKCNDATPTDDRPVIKDSTVPFRRPLRSLGIRQLRLMARDQGLKRYSQYTKPQLLEFLKTA